ncbi:efflux RND transporter periplasmic adaptor subunit [Psychrobacter sp. HD31]|uniref:efflux RND transporter periplasmic adaptor subunit n=1 Tax=Psychrobacter sp. HD31 TaxID=3112003 RepID=UPI003DA1E526
MKLSSISLVLSAALSVEMLTACSQGQNEQAAAQQEMPLAVVNIMPVQFQSIPQFKTFSGRTVAFESSEVRPQATGIIEEILFREGSPVKKGQALYRINADNYTNAIESGKSAIAQANASLTTAKASRTSAQASLLSQKALLEQAQSNYNRYTQLLSQDAVSAQLVDQAKTEIKTAQAGVKAAEAAIAQANAGIETATANITAAKATMSISQLNASRTIITAPISGITGSSNFTVGTLVNASQANPLVTITKTNPIYVDINQSSSQMLQLRQDIASGKAKQGINSVELMLENGSSYEQKGQLALREVNVNASTGSVTLRAVFPNNGLLMPGMFVTARMAQSVIPNAVLLPQSAIMRTPKGETQVYIVDDENTIKVRPVTVDGAYKGNWVITSGLRQGENVVAIGGAKVKPEQKVNAKPMPNKDDHVSQKPNKNSQAESTQQKVIDDAPVKAKEKPQAEAQAQTPKTPQQAADEQAQKEAAAMADQVDDSQN